MNKLFYFLIQMTWGILTFLAGFIVTLFVRIFVSNAVTRKNGWGVITSFGGNWGGLALGPFAFCGNYKEGSSFYDHTRKHEFGHSIQVLFMGPFFIFIVAIPSALRYWYYRLTPGKKHKEYDDVWFEGTATKWGTKWVDKIENKTKLNKVDNN